MGDLISRSALIDKFNDTGIQITFDLPVEEKLGEDVDLEAFAELVQDAVQAYKKMVIDVIQNLPTAYNVDAVVEYIQDVKKNFEDVPVGYSKGVTDAFNVSIATIRKGGVNGN